MDHERKFGLREVGYFMECVGEVLNIFILNYIISADTISFKFKLYFENLADIPNAANNFISFGF